MAACFRMIRLPVRVLPRAGSFSVVARAALLLALAGLSCIPAFAQNTTISGTVYDPRTTSAALPLPNVLVYAVTSGSTVAALPAGVQCLTYQAPTGVVSYTYTAVDGTFTLANIPENASYTIVIQAGKWRRQFPNTAVAAAPLTGLQLHMPADHTQGDIPMIAIVTGSVDGVECVLRDMGIADSEFADDNTDPSFTDRIHLYQGAGGTITPNPGVKITATGGAVINKSTPSETALTGNSNTLASYDMVMFPCQGAAIPKSSAEMTNIVDFANAGGRMFATHYAYDWLYPDSPYDSQFAPVANWSSQDQYGELDEQDFTSGVGTVATDFSDGATLAQWLQNAGATRGGSSNEILIGTLRTDVSSVIAPTQSWLTYNDQISHNPVMQMTFNTPVGAPAASQCGRVMYNDYHVIALLGDTGAIFPKECPSETSMSAQEEMLEYALFDLSTFVQPVVVPTLTVNFTPSPLVVNQNQSGDQVTVNVVNTSSTTEISSSAVLTFTLPPLVTATAITDSTGGWNCTAATLTCTRNSSLGGGVTDSVTLTLSVGAYPSGGLSSYTGQIVATVSSVTFSNNPSAQDQVVFQQQPTITWATPAPIVYGTALGSAQLDASAPVAGTFTYSPAAGAVLAVGQQTLNATFTPTDSTDYTTSTASVTLTVNPSTPVITLTASAPNVFLSGPVTFTATVPIPGNSASGTMTFYDGTTAIGSAALSGGSASITVSNLPAGANSITAVYSGDSNYGSATSSAITETVQDFTLTAPVGTTVSALAATEGSFTLAVTPVDGPSLPGAISLTVTGLPVDVSGQFNPAAIAANSPATEVILNVKLPGSAALRKPASPFGKGALPFSLALVLAPFAFRRRVRGRLFALIVAAAMGAALTAGVSGCGGGLAPYSFSFPVTASSGTLSHSLTVTLIVEPPRH